MSLRRSRHATLWLQILLIGGLACVVIVLVQSFRMARSNRTVVERAMGDYADFAAWSYAQHLSTRMREAVEELLRAVNHGDGLHMSPQIPDAQDMGHYIPEAQDCNCHRPIRGPMPLRFLAFTLGSDTVAEGRNFGPPKLMGWLADPDDPRAVELPARLTRSDEKRWLNRLLTDAARQPGSEWGYRVQVERYEGEPRLIASRLMATAWGDTIVYAVEYAPAALDTLFASVMASSALLPAAITSGRPNADVLDLEVLDARGGSLYQNGRKEARELDATAQLPATYGGLLVRAHLRYDMREEVLIGGAPESRVPIMLVILVLAVGLTALAAVQLRREVRFAAERSEFVANVSHELRTPLSQIRLALDTIRLGRAQEPADRDQALSIADREALRLQHLVEGVLRYSRGARSSDTPRQVTDAAVEVRSVIAEFDALAQPHQVAMTVTGDASANASLQRGALRQVLLNLLDNAVKYGGDGTRVQVDVRALAGGGVRLTVDDNGPGVPVSERDRIFRAFERGGVARRRAAGGSGIGLTIVRQVAAEHGGRAWVEDAPGGGARFVVEFHGSPR